METKDLAFNERHGISIEDTKDILRRLYKVNHFEHCKIASTSDDIKGVDAWIDGKPCQLKVREGKNGLVRSDYLICIHQPFLGFGHAKTNFRWEQKFDWGRDYQGLVVDHCSEYYYVAPKHEGGPFVIIARCESLELAKIAKETVAAWENCDTISYQGQFAPRHFTPEMTQKWMSNFSQRVVFNHGECQIRWVKNGPREPYGKFLLFVPQNIVKSNEVLWNS